MIYQHVDGCRRNHHSKEKKPVCSEDGLLCVFLFRPYYVDSPFSLFVDNVTSLKILFKIRKAFIMDEVLTFPSPIPILV